MPGGCEAPQADTDTDPDRRKVWPRHMLSAAWQYEAFDDETQDFFVDVDPELCGDIPPILRRRLRGKQRPPGWMASSPGVFGEPPLVARPAASTARSTTAKRGLSPATPASTPSASRGAKRVRAKPTTPSAPLRLLDVRCESQPPFPAMLGTLVAAPAASLATPPTLCFTCTGFEMERELRKSLERTLGVKVLQEWSPYVTHLVASSFRRTTKMMCAVCVGAHIVSPEFLTACNAQGAKVDEAPYLLRDTVCETAFARKHGLAKFELQTAVQHARRRGPLLSGSAVHCLAAVPGRTELQTLVIAAGGQWLPQMPTAMELTELQGQLLVLGSAASGRRGRLDADAAALSVAYDAELLREAACTQVLRLTKYKL